MVGIVIVSHSATLARGVVELAREMGGPDVPLEIAGGIEAEGPALGTDAALVARAIERADRGDGVLVLMDLGSAVLSAEMALDLLPEERRGRVLLCDAPLVEGAVAAAVTARLGASLEEVAREARGALGPKVTHLGGGEEGGGRAEAPPGPEPSRAEPPGAGERSVRLVVRNRLGLHARPAARFVQTAGSFDAEVLVTDLTTGRGPTSGRSLNALATLGVRQGHEVLVAARGPQAEEALAALEALAARDFDDAPEAAGPPEAPVLVPASAALPGAEAAPGAEAVPGAGISGPTPAFRGLPASPGVAIGPARWFRPPSVEVPPGPAGDPDAEERAIQQALDEAGREIAATRASVAARAGEYHARIFDAHLLFLRDEALLEPTRRAIREEGLGAAQAWDRATRDIIARYEALDDEYLRARAADLAAVAGTVLRHLVGGAAPGPVLAGPGILLAPDLTPAETAGLDRTLVQGIGTAYGGPTSHSAILARSLGIPAVVGAGEGLLEVPEGTTLVLDGDSGAVYVDPPPDVLRAYQGRRAQTEEAEWRARRAALLPAVTRDGRRVEVGANLASPEEATEAVAAGAEGVGLLRTEFLFLGRDSLPGEEEQVEAYRSIARALGGRPLVIRTLDVGADKPLPALPRPPEPNPFLGIRGLRLALAVPGLLLTQLRAVLRVAAEHPVRVMFPMVAGLAELRTARAVVEEARETLSREGIPLPRQLEVGIMVEVPSAALCAGRLAAEADFFSIGTNDLAQYTMAADRGNERVAALADPLHPAVLRLVEEVVRAARERGRWVGVCGEAAGDPVAVPLLVGLGVDELSMAPARIPQAKAVIRELDSGQAADLARRALTLASAEEVRGLVEEVRGSVAGSGRP